MTEHEELLQARARLRAELESTEAQLQALARHPVDPALEGLAGEVAALRSELDALEAEVFEGHQQLDALRADLARVQALAG